MSIQANFPAIKPTLLLDFANTEALDPRITYSRASTGTYYDGKTVAKAEENLLLWSQEFQNTGWLRSGAAIAADTSIAPDGTTTADTLTASAGSNSHLTQRLASVVANQNYTYTIYAKYATAQYIAFGFASGALGSAWAFVTVDIQNGTITQTTNGSNLSSTALGAVTSVGNGWYRITVTGSHSQTDTYPTIHIVNTSTPSFGNFGAFTWTAAGTETVLLWGAQLEQRSTVTAYTPTTTAPITNYIPVMLTAASGVPRFEHNPVTGESLGLEIEEQRTNLLTYSEQFDNAAWTKGGATITANTVVAPDGTLTGDKLIEDTSTGDHRTFQTAASITTGVAYTFSTYVKPAGRTLVKLTSATGAVMEATYDISAGTVTNTVSGTAAIVSAGNGWYRLSLSVTASVTDSTNMQIRLVDTGTNTTYTGNGFSGIYIWGAQLEAGAFPTSYIPTVASQVTRAADSASMTGANFSSWYRQDEGSFYAEATAAALSSTAGDPGTFVGISDGTVSNRLRLKSENGTAWEGAVAGTSQFAIGTYGSAGVSYKLAGAYKVNDFAYSFNGTTAATDTLGTVPVVSQMQIGNLTTAREFNGTIRKITYYPARVTNAQLQALTS